MAPHALARVLLVEDDTSITRFVQLALDELPIDLVACTNVPDALQVLRSGAVQLIITDLMLPGESGIGLVQRLLDEPALRAGATPVAVFSAGLTPAVREQLAALKVWRTLSKPASVLDLEACVRDALGLHEAGEPAAPTAVQSSPALSPREEHAIATHFFGDAFLFQEYQAGCLRQFPTDVRQGDAACAAQDWAALRRLAHSLATVLLTLGHAGASTQARALEDAACQPLPPQCIALWARLRDFLVHL